MSYHKKISFIKSGLRIFGFSMLIQNLKLAATFLVVAEILGILEEVKEK